MTSGYDSGDKTPLEAVAYVSFQELATRVSHRNTGKATGDPIADKLLARIATDENLHMIFYRNLVTAAFDIAPDETMKAVADEVMQLRDARRQHGRLPEELDDHRQGRHLRPAAAPRRGRRARSCGPGRSSTAPTSAPRARRPARSWREFLAGLDAQATKFVESRERMRARMAARARRRYRCERVRPRTLPPDIAAGAARAARRVAWTAGPLGRTGQYSCGWRPGTSTRSAAGPTGSRRSWSGTTSTCWPCRRPSAGTTSSPRWCSTRSATRSRRRPLAVERRRDPVPGRAGRRRDRLPRSRPGRRRRAWTPRTEARALGATCGGVRVWSLYVPNGRTLADPHLQYKLDWLAGPAAAAAGWLAKEPEAQVALVGDWNIAPQDDDVWDMVSSRTPPTSPRRSARHSRPSWTPGSPTSSARYAPGPASTPTGTTRSCASPAARACGSTSSLGSPALAGRVDGRADRPGGAQGQGRQRPRPASSSTSPTDAGRPEPPTVAAVRRRPPSRAGSRTYLRAAPWSKSGVAAAAPRRAGSPWR